MNAYRIGGRATIGRNGRTYTGTITRVGTTREGLTTVTIEYRITGGRGTTATATGIVGIDTIRVIR